jgi:hypothetical protein
MTASAMKKRTRPMVAAPAATLTKPTMPLASGRIV